MKRLLLFFALFVLAVAAVGVFRALQLKSRQVPPGMASAIAVDPARAADRLAAAISIDNVANGIAGTAFIAYMSSLTSKQYTATQYALFGTLWSLPAKTIASQWGRIVDAVGYPTFFVYTAIVALPALLLIMWLMRSEARARLAPAASGAGA